uniref:Uncharacterized protein n=1 Tax=Apis cerana TaxID=7461 RepID=V9IJJ2_APICE
MSLFPAYSEENKSTTSNESNNFLKENESTSWLYNSSCLEQISSNNFIDVSSDSSDETFYFHKEETLYTTSVKKKNLHWRKNNHLYILKEKKRIKKRIYMKNQNMRKM